MYVWYIGELGQIKRCFIKNLDGQRREPVTEVEPVQ